MTDDYYSRCLVPGIEITRLTLTALVQSLHDYRRCTIQCISTILVEQLVDSSRISNVRSETLSGVLGTPVWPHGFCFDASAS